MKGCVEKYYAVVKWIEVEIFDCIYAVGIYKLIFTIYAVVNMG